MGRVNAEKMDRKHEYNTDLKYIFKDTSRSIFL